MDREAIRALARRDWRAVESGKRAYWVERFRRAGSAATLAAARAMWEHMRRVRPDWPSEEDRAADLADHIALKRKLERAAHAFTTR